MKCVTDRSGCATQPRIVILQGTAACGCLVRGGEVGFHGRPLRARRQPAAMQHAPHFCPQWSCQLVNGWMRTPHSLSPDVLKRNEPDSLEASLASIAKIFCKCTIAIGLLSPNYSRPFLFFERALI